MHRSPASAGGRLLRALALVAPLAATAAAQAFDLTVEVLNAKSASGTVNAAVFASETGWLKDIHAVQGQKVPAGERIVIVYRNLPAGTYAVSMFHDENGNDKLDVNVVGLPTERFGFSRDARGHMGPPRFSDAAFELNSDATVSVRLN